MKLLYPYDSQFALKVTSFKQSVAMKSAFLSCKSITTGRQDKTSHLDKYIFLLALTSFTDADLRGKELVMRLMMHPDPNVQKQALLCVQKIMLAKDKLQFLNAQNEP